MTTQHSEWVHDAAPIVSSFCGNNGCVGVVPGVAITVVDTKIGDGPRLTFTRDEWAAFVAGVKNGEFDLA